MPKRFLIVAGFADSLVLFRRDLLAALVARGLTVYAMAPELTSNAHTSTTLERLGVHLYDIPAQRAGTNPLADLWLLWRLYWLMRRIRPDIVLGYTIKPVIYGIIAAWLARVPHRYALITGLGYAFTNGRGGALRRLVQRMYAFALHRAHKVFFQNPDDCALFGELHILPSSVPAVVVNGSGVDLGMFPAAVVSPRPLRFLMICRLLGDKGVREYVDAAQRIRAKCPDVRFGLAGWIDENPDAISQSELSDWVAGGDIEYLGKLDDVRPALTECSVYVLPSYREGTPRTVLEAMAVGRPVITTDAPGCRETVIDGRNGFLVPVKSVDALVAAMERFIEDPGLAQRMGQESRKIAKSKYDVHKVNKVMLREMGITCEPRVKAEIHG